MSVSPGGRNGSAARSVPSNKDKDARQESLLFARRDFNEVSFELIRGGRASLDELDEQVFLLGGGASDELIKARDEAAVAYSRMSGLLADYDGLLASWVRRSMQ